jgi:Helicase conserved C-terminal domain
MENRVEEFQVLVSHLRPDLVLDVTSVDGLIGADRFRTAVFRDVLDIVASVLGDLAVGPLTGSTPPIHRQSMVGQFTARRGPAVLVSQIQAGGVGLNIQAASVVILTGPQWKPTVEDQAVARCHRMGQVRPVDVHRLLAEDTVDCEAPASCACRSSRLAS